MRLQYKLGQPSRHSQTRWKRVWTILLKPPPLTQLGPHLAEKNWQDSTLGNGNWRVPSRSAARWPQDEVGSGGAKLCSHNCHFRTEEKQWLAGLRKHWTKKAVREKQKYVYNQYLSDLHERFLCCLSSPKYSEIAGQPHISFWGAIRCFS